VGQFGADDRLQTALMNVRFEGNNGHDADVTRCLLMTQCGHWTTGYRPLLEQSLRGLSLCLNWSAPRCSPKESAGAYQCSCRGQSTKVSGSVSGRRTRLRDRLLVHCDQIIGIVLQSEPLDGLASPPKVVQAGATISFHAGVSRLWTSAPPVVGGSTKLSVSGRLWRMCRVLQSLLLAAGAPPEH
jgi:hypothetical protein